MSNGIQIYSSSGGLANSYGPAGTQAFDLDNAGNTVVSFTPSGGEYPQIERFANGSNVQNGSYQRMDTNSLQLVGNAAGTIVTDGIGDPFNLEDPDEDYEDVWYDGASGTPAATYVGGPGSGDSFDPGIIAVAPDDVLIGTFGDETLNFYARGQTTPSRTISPDANDEYFGGPLVAANGTVYVAEGPYSGGSFAVQVTPAQGSSYAVSVPSKPVGLDLDGQGNLYVLINGSQSVASLLEFAPNATSAQRTVSSGLTSGAIGLLVTPAGVAYIEQVSQTGSGVPFGSSTTMPCDGLDTYTGCSEIVQVSPRATAATPFVPNYSGDSSTFEMGYIDGSGVKMLRTHYAGARSTAARRHDAASPLAVPNVGSDLNRHRRPIGMNSISTLEGEFAR